MSSSHVEEWARRIVQRELGRAVELHDDGCFPGMYDLRVGPAAVPDLAIECVGAVDPVRTETWNVGPARGPTTMRVRGDWHVVLRPNASVKAVRARLESLLQDCETFGVDGFVPVDWALRRANPSLFEAFNSLQIDSVTCFRPFGSGEVHLGMTGGGGWVDTSGVSVPGWIRDFLLAPQRADVLSKLGRSGASERHVFVPVAFGGVPRAVESYLCARTQELPATAPDLPPPVDGVWIACSTKGIAGTARSGAASTPVIPVRR